MNSFWQQMQAALAVGLAPVSESLVDTLMRPSNGSAMFWCRWPGRRSYRAAQREARVRRNRRLHHGRRS